VSTVSDAVRVELDAADSGASNPLLEFILRYQDDPAGFVANVYGVELDEWQAELMRAVAAGERRISVRSGHGVGKSASVALLCVWALLCFPVVKIVITAPSGPQLYDALYAEVKLWISRLPDALRPLLDVQSDRVEVTVAPASAFLSVRTSRAETPEALQGIHAEEGRVILIADEASGIPEPVFEAGAGSMSGHNCTTVLLGNPTRTSGLFFDTHHKLADMWRRFHVSCVNSKRVAADFIADMKARYGEDSNAYRVRVLGEFPRRDDDTLIALELVEAAMARDIALDPQAVRVWGVDVARFGSDKSVLTKRWGKVVPEKPRAWRGLDLMQLVGAIKHEYDLTPPDAKPSEILVDVIGLGAGVVDRLRELKLPCRGINVAESPAFDPDGQYVALRDELWGKGRAWLEARDCRLPNDPSLLELSIPRYTFQSSGKMKVESKSDMKKRGLGSPDYADSFLLTFASDAVTGSKSYGSNWSQPLRRRIKGVV
jgi:phage terminase large subunit